MTEVDEAEATAAIRHHLNEGWDGQGWAPYDLLVIGRSVLATGHNPASGPAFWNEQLAVARQRYRDGFYANPFGEPVRRPS